MNQETMLLNPVLNFCDEILEPTIFRSYEEKEQSQILTIIMDDLEPIINEAINTPYNNPNWVGPNNCTDSEGHDLRSAIMKEDGIDHPIQVCKKCGWWG